MGTFFRSAVALGLLAACGVPAAAQTAHCTTDTLHVDGINVEARFCVPPGAGTGSVSVAESFTAGGKTFGKTTPLAVVSGASTSRTIDDVDLGSLGAKHSLHMTLAYRDGEVVLEHALALPGAIPVK